MNIVTWSEYENSNQTYLVHEENLILLLSFDGIIRLPSLICMDPELSTTHILTGKASLFVERALARPTNEFKCVS